MPSSASQKQTGAGSPNAAQSADYTYDMLLSLRQLAAHHKQIKLVHLIEAAAAEALANSVAKSD